MMCECVCLCVCVCVCVCVLVTKPCLCNLMDCSQPGSSVHGILQARILEVKCKSLSCVWTSMRSPWNSPSYNTGVDSLSLLQGIFPTQGIKPRSSTLQADPLPAEPQGKPKNTGVGAIPFSLPDPGIEPRSPALQADSLPSEPPGRPVFMGKAGLKLKMPLTLAFHFQDNRGYNIINNFLTRKLRPREIALS